RKYESPFFLLEPEAQIDAADRLHRDHPELKFFALIWEDIDKFAKANGTKEKTRVVQESFKKLLQTPDDFIEYMKMLIQLEASIDDAGVQQEIREYRLFFMGDMHLYLSSHGGTKP
ncbi:MAG: hypothetical protein UW24_C0029G0001, partial [Parcubacteria group bacterium GW2011_GWA2_44_12]